MNSFRPRFAFTAVAALSAAVALSPAVRADNLASAGPNVRPLPTPAGPKPFAYTNAPDAMPNYLAGEKWGTEGEKLSTMQLPLTPADSAKRIVTQPGFATELWAGDPDITKPIALAWDERGRLWVAETVDYPNELQPAGQGRDRIKICEDTNGDGRADKFTVFADKLSIPTSLCFANGGLVVIEGGRTLFLKDTTGDGVADERRVLFSGWGTGDTHATASNLRYGADNWIWGTVGYSGFDGEVGGKRHRFGMGVYRFKPDGSALEFIRSSNNNTWGLGLSEDGIVFGSTANNNASWHMAIPNRFYEAVRGWSASRMETIADSQAFYPVTDKVRQVDAHGKYTAGAGHALYTARAFPQEYWNRIAFVTEPTGHLIGFFRLDPDGAGFKAVNLGSFLASDDEWAAPIVAEVGPDGALWVLDWYNYIVQHNPTPIGFKTGKGNAYETSLRDKRHGRIYRVVAKGGTPTRAPKLAAATPAELVAALKNDNQLWRLHAQRLLVERGQKDVVPALAELTRDAKQDAVGLNVGAMHALWTLDGLGAAEAAAVPALKHPAAGVRRAAVNVLPRTEAGVTAVLAAGVLKDADPQVRLAALLALAEMPDNPEAGLAVAVALTDPRTADDRWLREAAAAAGARHLGGFGRALLSHQEPLPPAASEAIRIIARHYAAAAPDGVVQVIEPLPQTAPTTAVAVLEGLAAGWPEDRKPTFDDDARAQLGAAMKALPDVARDPLLVLAQKWGRLDLFPEQVAATTARLRAQLADASLADPARLAAARNLLRLADSPATVSAVLAQVTLQAPPALAGGLLNALGESRSPATGPALLAQWSRFTPAQQRAAVATLLRRGPWTAAVLEQLEAGSLQAGDLGREQWQQLINHPDAALAARAKTLAGRRGSLTADREEVVKKFLPVARQDGDRARGKEVYTANCGVCHLFYGQGGKVGPDLSGIGARPKEDILTDILDPNRSVEANYVLWTVTTKGGDTLAGRLDTETQTSIELYDLAGQKHSVQRQDIAALEASKLSIMPSGFEQLGEKDLAALLTFLAAGQGADRH